jgi:dTMP kinase
MPERGKYIVFEGGDFVGKSTQVKILADSINCAAIREPGGTDAGERIRSILLSPEIKTNPRTEVLLHAAARAEAISEIVNPLIKSGVHVASDRSWFSSAAYQGAHGMEMADIEDINKFAVGEFFIPDLLLLLDADPAELRARRGDELDYYEQQHEDFHKKVRENYLELGKKFGAVIIDATTSVEEVSQEVRSAVSERLGL